MNVRVNRIGHELEAPIPAAWVAVIAYSMVVGIFVADWFTTATAAGLAYEAPVVFAALKGSRRLTVLATALGIFGIVLAWFMDLVNASFHFSEPRIENRLLSVVSVLLVTSLALSIHRKVQSTNGVGQAAIPRESILLAADRVMSASATGSTIDVLTAEATRILDARVAVWFPAEPTGTFWFATDAALQSSTRSVEFSANVQSLALRLHAEPAIKRVSPIESIDLVAGAPTGCKSALAISIGERFAIVGTIIVGFETPGIEDETFDAARDFASFASSAMQQVRFFDRISNSGDGSVVTRGRA